MKIKRELPYLEDYGKNIFDWIDDLKEILILYDVTEPKILASGEDDIKV